MPPQWAAAALKSGDALGSVFAAGNRGILRGQRINSANIMPEIKPLRPIIHWRIGKPATVITLMFKSQ